MGWQDNEGTIVWFDPDHDPCLREWGFIKADGGLYHLHDPSPEDDDALTEAHPIVPHG
jgi:hypothetical protein